MAKKPRKALEPHQKEDAARLLKLWDQAKAKNRDWPAQAAFASKYSIGETQGIVWQYLHGVIPLNLPVALKFARGLKCSVAAFSPTLAAQLPKRVSEEAEAYNLPEETVRDILDVFEKLSPPQIDAAIEELRATAESNRETANRLKTKLRRPSDKHGGRGTQAWLPSKNLCESTSIPIDMV